MNPEIFLKDEIWSLSLKVCRQFLLITYPLDGSRTDEQWPP